MEKIDEMENIDETKDIYTLTIITNDDIKFKVPAKIVGISDFLLEIEIFDENIYLKEINSLVFIEFLYMYADIPMKEINKPLISSNIEEIVEPQYVGFIKSMDMSFFFHLCNGAYFLLIKPLSDLCNVYIATLIKGKTPEEMIHIFGIKKAYNKPNEDELRIKHKWAEYADCSIPIEDDNKDTI